MVLSSTADDQHISHRLPDPTRSFPSPLSPRMVLSLSHFALSGPSPSPRIACAALLPVQVYRLLYEPSFLFSFSCSCLLPLFSRPPSLLRHPGPSTSARLPSPAPPTLAPPSHPSALPTFLVLSPSFLALNSPSCPTLTLLAGLFSRPLHPHPSHFPHVRHPPCLSHSRLAACPFGPPSSRLAHPCDLTLADLTLSAWILGSRRRLTLSDTCPYPLSSCQFSPSHPPLALHALLMPSMPSSRPPHLHRPIAYADIKTLMAHEDCARVLQVT